jgi:hypothetical protein
MRLAVVGILLVAGCAHQSRLAGPHAIDDHAWRELTSRHFVLRTDLSSGQGRAALADFEQTYAALQALAFPDDPPRERISVVLFSDESDFRRVAPGGAAGYFMPHQYNDPDPQPTIAMHGRMLIAGTLVESTQRRFRHELTHRFLDHRLRVSPPWLEEGLAEYYSTLKIIGDVAEVGELPNKKLFRVDIHIVSSLIEGMVDDRVDFKQIPSVYELLTADYSTFHDPARELPFYAAAWTFVHMMLNGPFGYSQRFTRFLDLLTHGALPREAWQQCFYGVPVWRLEREFKDYIGKTEMDARAIKVSVPRASRPEAQRPLARDEVHLMLARIRPWDSRVNILTAGVELQAAARLAQPSPSPELHYWLGLYRERWRHFGEAERELRDAIAGEPRNSRYWLALCILLARGDRDDVVTAAELDDAVAHLVPLARSAQAFNFLARYYSDKGEIERGLPFAERAVETERGCWECVDTLAMLQSLKHSAPSTPDVYTRPGIY